MGQEAGAIITGTTGRQRRGLSGQAPLPLQLSLTRVHVWADAISSEATEGSGLTGI